MLNLLTASDDIAHFQAALDVKLRCALPDLARFRVGHRAATLALAVHTNGKIWYASRLSPDDEPTRYWNAFGFVSGADPEVPIVEVNFPLEGLKRGIGGIAAADPSTHELTVLHRGNMGGGRRGVGKLAFLAWYEQEGQCAWADVDEGVRTPARAILIGRLDDDGLLEGLYKFVNDVRRFKDRATGQ